MVAAPATALAGEAGDQQAISFSPALLFVEVDAGRRSTTSVLVQNQTARAVSFEVGLLDMQDGPGASLDFVRAGSAPRGAGGWMQVAVSRFRLRGATERRVEVRLAVPAGTRPGGYFGAVTFLAKDPDPGGQIPIDVNQPIPVYVTVRGATDRRVRASATPVPPIRWRGGRAAWRVRLHNAGELHEVVEGRLATDGVLARTGSAPLRPAILLPGERRAQLVHTALRDAPDLVAADVEVDGLPDGAGEGGGRRLLVLPWWLLVAVAVLAGVIAWRRRRPYDGAEAGEDEAGFDDSPHAG